MLQLTSTDGSSRYEVVNSYQCLSRNCSFLLCR